MKIISNFKDYYDHQAYIYGGGDPKIVYLRQDLDKLNKDIPQKDYTHSRHRDSLPYFTEYQQDLNMLGSNTWEKLESEFLVKDSVRERGATKWLCVCGKVYPLIEVKKDDFSTKLEIMDVKKHAHLIKTRRAYFNSALEYTPVGVELPRIVELSREIKAPVFIILSDNWVVTDKIPYPRLEIANTIPVLSEIGFASICDANMLYQELSYFVANKMNVSPDMMPAIVQNDKEKITQHGFDLKKSFRHRK